ncbi:MAG: ABC transporter ATP-binding protein [Deltaproteobacteria bacterium]|nr:ABC transporter ATP-binding protein [Deltaproteobacteria bacterium]
MLEVKGIHTFYGLSHILFDVSLKVNAGEVVCLLGRNGAGKSTTIKSIMGIAPPRQGRIIFKGEDVAGRKPYILARRGMGYDPDDRRIFADLTVEENLEIAIKGYVEGEGWNKERVYDFFPALKVIRHRRGGVLSGGEQKMLAIARALMGNPELLLLDEPTEGLAPVMVRVLEEQLMNLKKTGLTVLLAEQNLVSTLKLSDRGYIIDNGRIRFEGTVQELRDNEEIQKQCLMV